MEDPKAVRQSLVVFGAAGCGLCEQMLHELDELRWELDFEVKTVDIAADEVLEAAYRTRIPVLVCGGKEICEFFLDPEVLRRTLEAGHC